MAAVNISTGIVLSQIIPHRAHYGATPGSPIPSTRPGLPSRNSRQDPTFPGITSPLHPSPPREEFVWLQRGSKGSPDPAGCPSTALGQGEGAHSHRGEEILGFVREKEHQLKRWRNLPAQGNLKEDFVGEMQSFFQHHSRSAQDFFPLGSGPESL